MSADYVCPNCRTRIASEEAQAARFRCPRCAQAYLVRRSPSPVSLRAVIPTASGHPAASDNYHGEAAQEAVSEQNHPPKVAASASDGFARTAQAVSGGNGGAIADGPPGSEPIPEVLRRTVPEPERAVVAVTVLPPAHNLVDVTAMEQLAGTFAQLPSSVSLEIAGNAAQRRLIVRGESRSVQRMVDQLYHVYRQVDTQALPEAEDPACLFEQPGGVTCLSTLRPIGPAFVSLRTWREFEGNDPLNPLLGAYAGLRSHEIALSQVVIHGAAPERWAEPHLQQLNAFKRRGFGGERPMPSLSDMLLGFGGAALMLMAMAVFMLVYWSSFSWRYVVGVPLGLTLMVLGVWLTMLKRNEWAVTLDTEAEAKLREQAFQVELRVYARALTAERAQAILNQIAAAYQLFNTTSGNRLKPVPSRHYTSPNDLSPTDRRAVALFSVKEIAGLWHMPVGEALELVERAMYQRLLPLPTDVTHAGGALLGVSRKGPYAIPVQLSPEALNHNTLVIGKTQFGKTTLMEHLISHWMRDRDRAVLVIDPHGDLARRVTGLVPQDRVGEVILIDLSDASRSVGLNLLDVSGGANPDDVSETFVDVGKALWENYWGPRMLIPLVNGLKALAYANLHRPPDRQYTILSLATLLDCDDNPRETFLNSEVPAHERPDLHRYFFGEYKHASDSMREQVISPVLSKAHAFERSAAIRRLVSQPRSTVNLYEAIRQHKIIIINTTAGILGDDLADFLGSLFLNVLRRVIMSQAQLPRAERVRVSVVADEFQKLTGVDFGALLGELQKYGGNFILGTQALDLLRHGDEGEKFIGGLLAGVANLVAFQLNGDDARYLTERDFDKDQLRPQSLIHLPMRMAYVRTLSKDGRVPAIFSLDIAPPPQPDPLVVERVLALASAYTVPADEADRLVKFSFGVFEEEWALRPDTAATPSASDSTTSSPTQTAEGVPPNVQEATATARPRRAARPPGWKQGDVPPRPLGEAANGVDVRMNR